VVRVAVCVKRVPAPGARIALNADGTAIDTKNLGFTTSPHEECAVEEAIRLAERHGGSTTVLTVGPPAAEEQLRYALSVGANDAVLAISEESDGTDLDPQATARALVETIAGLEADAGPFDLILFGNESADGCGYQVGIRVARAFGRPMVNGIKAIEVGDGIVSAYREAAEGSEVYRLAMPAALGVKEGINLPRYPTLPGRLRSNKATIEHTAITAAPGGLRTSGFELPVEELTATTILGTGAEAAPAVVDWFEELGVV
jgi:electron transfer flavoprotein beta subunit